ncbi:MAG TPA: hypothetical protein VJ950_08975, partial [Acidimicrobiia bacterium]|nr:hypothetical protein [Acidimicrobiia bacterium]
MHRLTAAAAALIVTAACTGDSGTTSTVVDQTTAPEATEPLPTDASELPGRLVVVDDDGNIVTMEPDGSASTNITQDGGEAAGYRQPAFSPVSDTVVWSEINAEGSGLGSSDGQGENRISVPMAAPPFYMFWSPDGNGIGVLHNSAAGAIEFEVVDVGATTSEVLAEGSSFYFSWSPDSSQVAAHARPEFFGTIGLDGESSDLGATAPGYQAPHWIPAGILHLAEAGLELRQTGGESRLLATAPGPVAFVANRQGTSVAVQSFVEEETPPGVNAAVTETPAIPSNTVVVIDVDSGEMSEVVGAASLGLFWSPDGESLLVLTPDEGGAAELATTVWRAGETTELSTISPNPTFVGDVLRFFDQYGQSLQLWSPDSAAFALPGAIDDDPGIWVYLVAGG